MPTCMHASLHACPCIGSFPHAGSAPCLLRLPPFTHRTHAPPLPHTGLLTSTVLCFGAIKCEYVIFGGGGDGGGCSGHAAHHSTAGGEMRGYLSLIGRRVVLNVRFV